MGLFGNNDRQAEIAIAKEMAHDANDVNKEIGEIVSIFDENHSSLENVSETMAEFSERLSTKLDIEDLKDLVEITELVGKLHTHYLESFSAILELSNNQNIRTKDSIDKYEAISKG